MGRDCCGVSIFLMSQAPHRKQLASLMRPTALNPLFASAQSLTGIGPRVDLLLKKALRLPPGIADARVIDLTWHTPTGVIDRRATPTVSTAIPGTIVTLEVRVLKHKPSPRGNNKAPYKVTCEDETGRLELIFFHAEHSFVARQLPEGEVRFVSGRIERYNDQMQMTHPDYIVRPEKRDDLPMLEPIYPLTAGLSGKILQKACRQAADKMPDVVEWLDPAWLAARAWPDLKQATTRLHRPTDAGDVSAGSPIRQRLAYDELLAGQLALGLVRQVQKSQRGRVVTGNGKIRRRTDPCFAVFAHRRPDALASRDHRRHGRPAPYAPFAARRCGVWQNCRCAHGHGDCSRSRRAGRTHGTDGSACPAAP